MSFDIDRILKKHGNYIAYRESSFAQAYPNKCVTIRHNYVRFIYLTDEDYHAIISGAYLKTSYISTRCGNYVEDTRVAAIYPITAFSEGTLLLSANYNDSDLYNEYCYSLINIDEPRIVAEGTIFAIAAAARLMGYSKDSDIAIITSYYYAQENLDETSVIEYIKSHL